MRDRQVVGLFLLVAGAMFLILQPTYIVRSDIVIRGIEAESPVEEQRPIPGWVGVLAVLSGGALLLPEGVFRRRR